MNATAYKSEQIEFVSGHHGTTLDEIAVVVSSAPLGFLLQNLCLQHRRSLDPRLKFVLEYLCVVFPVLLSFTLLSEVVTTFLVMLATLCCTIIFFNLAKVYSFTDLLKVRLWWTRSTSGKRQFISVYRANVNLATAISILAVDFSIFPRRFCKAETFGTGLMDVGVGAFIISNAIVSPEARGKNTDMSNRSIISKAKMILHSLQSSSPLWFLGAVRLLAVKGTDYHEHVSEYGVHWNFFFTLAITKVCSTIILTVFHHNLSWVLAVGIAFIQQYLLKGSLNLQHFALNGYNGRGSRNGFIDANREGIISCLGYLAIYFAGVQLGKFLLKPRAILGDWIKAFIYLVLLDGLFWLVLYFADVYIDPVSRRLANLSYILWMMSYNIQLIASFLLMDIISEILDHAQEQNSNKEEFNLLEAVNYNGLLYFLLANVFTGLVNLTVQTIYLSKITAFVILNSYMTALSVITAVLYKKRICFKFW